MFSERQVNRGTGIVARSRVYEPTSTYETGDFEGDPFSKAPDSMKMAVLTGLVRYDFTHADVQASSTPGPCTFVPFTSMGICALVEDVTADIVKIYPQAEEEDECAWNYTIKALCDDLPFKSNPLYIHGRSGDALYVEASRIWNMVRKPVHPEDIRLVRRYIRFTSENLRVNFTFLSRVRKLPRNFPTVHRMNHLSNPRYRPAHWYRTKASCKL